MISIRNRQIAWIVSLFAVCSAAWVSHITAKQYVQNEADVRHTLAVRAAITDTLSLVKDAETGQRGYMLTGDLAFLSPYSRAESQLPDQLAVLRQLTRDDPEQAQSAREVERMSIEKLAFLKGNVELRRSGQFDAALVKIRGGQGNRLMEALRAETERMTTRETARLKQREDAAAAGEKRTWAALSVALGLALALVLGGLYSVRREAIAAARARQQLLESERAFRTLADNASDLVRIVGADLVPTYVSPSSLTAIGYTPEETRALGGGTLLHPDERAEILRLVAEVRTTGQPAELHVHRLLCKDGAYRWFETRIQTALDQSGMPGSLHLSSRDVTARKFAEDALRKQTARLESILGSMGDGVLVLDQERRVVVVNPSAAEHVRHSEGEQISAAKWAEQYSAFTADGVTPFPPEQGPLTRALQGEACDAVEMILQDRAGKSRVFAITSRPIRDEGKAVGCVGVYHDITVQRRAERELLESERRWRVLSEASFEGVAISRFGMIVDTNGTFANWLGRTPAELIGVDGVSLFAREDREQVAIASTDPGSVYEARLVRADGSLLPVEIRGRVATLNGETVRLAVIRDVTERKLREAELRQQTELLRSLSLRDELTGLYNRRGFLELGHQQLRQAIRARRGACLFFADLNGMKAINDTFGHEAGDKALAASAKVLLGVFRDSDVIARLGGDEFAALALDCDAQGLAQVRARVRAAVDAFNSQGLEPFRLSISMGGALHDPESGTTLETMMEVADVKMYEEKKARGRARMESLAPRMAPPQLKP